MTVKEIIAVCISSLDKESKRMDDFYFHTFLLKLNMNGYNMSYTDYFDIMEKQAIVTKLGGIHYIKAKS